MLTYNGVTYHVDEKANIAYFFNESRMSFCKDCPMSGKGYATLEDGSRIVSVDGCPCAPLRDIASASISKDAYQTIREAGCFDDLIIEIKNRDAPVGGGRIMKT